MRAKGICYIQNETEFVNMLKKFSPDGRYIYTFSPEHISYPIFLQIEKLSKDNKINGKDKEISLISARKAAQLIENKLPDAVDVTERAILEKMKSKALEEADKVPLTTVDKEIKRCVYIVQYESDRGYSISSFRGDICMDIMSARRLVKEIAKEHSCVEGSTIDIFRHEVGLRGKMFAVEAYTANGRKTDIVNYTRDDYEAGNIPGQPVEEVKDNEQKLER